jgi:RimJ/RimL family protein N-acetyltransferase
MKIGDIMDGFEPKAGLMISTERLILRRFRFEDVVDLIALVSDTRVAVEVDEFQPSEESVRAYIDRQNSIEPFGENQVMDLAIE